MGTSGTITGVTHFLKEKSDDIKCIGFYPNAPQHGLEGLKHMPSANPPGIYHPELLDQIFEIGTEEAYEMVQRLGREEGLFVGISSGAAALAALQVAESLDKGMVVTLFPDAGYKYLSKKMWY
jgi:cysteine synthase B